MKPTLEAPRLRLETASVVAFQRAESSFAWNWHYHPEIELTWIRKGHGTRLVGDHSDSYEAGDLVLLGPSLPHTWFSREDSTQNEAIVIQFRPQMFSEGLMVLPEFSSISQLITRCSRGLRFDAATGRRVGAMLKSLLPLSGLRRWMELARILHDLAAHEGEVLASVGYQHRRSFKLSSRLERVTTYIEKHCAEEIPLNEMARLAGLTPSAFSRFFRKMTHQTFVEFRNACRIREACRLLTDTDLAITEIAYACGFNNLANFNRRFRVEKNMPPRHFRGLHNPSWSGRAAAEKSKSSNAR